MADFIDPFFHYMGNKSKLAEWIVPYFPPHKRYVEVFGGTASILLNKPKSNVEVYNDFNEHLSNLFEVARVKYDEFAYQLDNLIISENTYNNFYKNHDVNKYADVEAAIRYFYVMSICGRGKYNGGFQYKLDGGFQRLLDNKKHIVEAIHKRVRNLIVVNRSFEKIISQLDSPDTLFYLDPPYFNTEKYYKHFTGIFDEEKHVELKNMLTKIQGMFFLSYEDEQFVRELYEGFYFIRKNTVAKGKTAVSGEKEIRQEILITNYKPQNLLFDTFDYGMANEGGDNA